MSKEIKFIIEGIIIYGIAGLVRIWLGSFTYVSNCRWDDVICLDNPPPTFHNTIVNYATNAGPLVTLGFFILATLVFGVVIIFQRKKK